MNYLVKTLIPCLMLLSSSVNSAPTAPPDLIKTTTDRLVSEFNTQREAFKANPSLLYKKVDEIASPQFDFERISSWVLGKYWRTASAEQKASFQQEFRSFLIRAYGGAINEYTGDITGDEITYLPYKAAPDADDVTVKTQVQPAQGPAIPITYSLHLQDDAWKVYDVIVEGTSLVTNYRLSFAQEIRKNGLDALIKQLSERNSENVAALVE